MSSRTNILSSIILLYLIIVGCHDSMASTVDLYQIIKCENPQFDPKIIGWFYGCYCGAGGAGTPVDNVDKCCQEHDRCYQQYQSYPGCSVFWPLLSTFDYSCQNRKATCHDSNPCRQAHCNCDIQFANCLHGIPTPSKKLQCKDYFRSQKTGFSWFTH